MQFITFKKGDKVAYSYRGASGTGTVNAIQEGARGAFIEVLKADKTSIKLRQSALKKS
ncbi:MAG: hypothetical protein AB9M53_01165 [Leptothrix sp. (in: b-proteobacteria)]